MAKIDLIFGKALLQHPFLSVLQIFHSHQYQLVGDLLAAQWDRIGFKPFCFLYRYHQDPLRIICLQLRDGVLAVFISLPGIIAVMIGFAANINRRVNKTVKSAGLKNVSLPQVTDSLWRNSNASPAGFFTPVEPFCLSRCFTWKQFICSYHFDK